MSVSTESNAPNSTAHPVPNRKRPRLAPSILLILFTIFFIYLFEESIANETTYIYKLGVWFFLFISGFHTFYYLYPDLTAKQAKEIDYFYLGIAAPGIFVLSSSYAEQRHAFYSRVFKESILKNTEKINMKKSQIDKEIEWTADQYKKYACPPKDERTATASIKAIEISDWITRSEKSIDLSDKILDLDEFEAKEGKYFREKISEFTKNSNANEKS